LLTHVPLQLMSPLAQAHVPLLQVAPPVQGLLQDPQLLSSVFSFTHSPPHSVYVASYELLQLMPHAPPPLQVAMPLAEGAGQAVHELPQLLTDVLLSHVPPQLCVPLAQHLPAEHESPLPQVVPQLPQLLLSVITSVHAVPHCV
jgi:hypothetical protein